MAVHYGGDLPTTLKTPIRPVYSRPDRIRIELNHPSIGEGFDEARPDTLFLAMPISWKGTLQQYVGRLHRLHDSKKVVEVYDYVDADVLMLARMYGRRLKGYADMGYKILSDAQQRLDLGILTGNGSNAKEDDLGAGPKVR